MTYTNCWLTYPLLANETGKGIAVSSDFSGPMVDSALEELKEGFGRMLRREVSLVESGADIAL